MKKTLFLLPIIGLLFSCEITFASNDSNNSNITSETNSTPIESTTSIEDSSNDSIDSVASVEESIVPPTSDPYVGMNSREFYASYTESQTYQDARYRTLHGFMSGDITPQTEIPASNTNLPKDNNGSYYRVSDANYEYDETGNYASYTTNTLDGTRGTKIFYGAAYTSLEEVAAYLLAFGEVPPNSNYETDEQDESISTWGEYGRVNKGVFSNNVSYYKYEPELPSLSSVTYIETDFGTEGFICGEGYSDAEYNDGNKITRGAARFVFVEMEGKSGSDVPFNTRRVFYTYNHYNDFQEYLNYEGGWGQIFGFTTAGNDYCNNMSTYNKWLSSGKDINDPTPYPSVTLISANNIHRL